MMTLGLRGKFGLALAAMTLMMVICAAIVIYSASRSLSSFDRVATTALPNLRIAERLARHGERAAAQIAALYTVQSEDVRQDLHHQWKQTDEALTRALRQAQDLRSSFANFDDLASQIGLIQSIRNRLDDAVGQHLTLTSQQEKSHQELLEAGEKFQGILEPLIAIAEREQLANASDNDLDARLMMNPALIEPAAGPSPWERLSTLRQLRQMTSDIVATLLAIEQESRLQHVQLAKIRAQSHADRVRNLLSSLDRDASAYLAELNQKILDIGTSPKGLPALRQEALTNESQMAALTTEASTAIRQLEAITDGLIQTASSLFDQDKQQFQDVQFQMSWLVIAAALCSILTSVGIGTFYVRRRLVQPIVQLSKAIKSFEHGGSVDRDLGESKDEIGQLGQAFVDMAQRRQKAETELAERNEQLVTANDKLESANIELERSNQELDSFAYIAAHDLKEPLRAMRNHAGFLIEDHAEQIGDDGVKRLNRLVELGGRMDQLIADLLYYARLGRDQQTLEPVDPNDLIAEIEADLADTLRSRKARVVVQDDLPTIEGNKPQIATVFRNLISNGTKYNDADDKVVEIGVDPDDQQASSFGTATFYVRDNGIGIEDSFRDDVFKIFKRLNSEKAYGEGTGAGLSFVKKIIENQGGRIWLESEPGEGTTFFLTLRRAA